MSGNHAITGVVLAGGRSTRFGDESKATAILGQRPLVDHVVDCVQATTERPPVVAAGPPDKRALVDDALSQTVRYAADADWCSGPLAGLCGALDECDAPMIFLCGCDMPLVSPRTVSWLVDYHTTTEADATLPVDASGEPQLLHAVYRTSALRDYCDSRPDDHRLRSLIDKLTADTIRPTATPDDVDVTRSMMNINTRRELASLDVPEDRNCAKHPNATTGTK